MVESYSMQCEKQNLQVPVLISEVPDCTERLRMRIKIRVREGEIESDRELE